MTAEGAIISPSVHVAITESVALLPFVLLLSRILKKQILKFSESYPEGS